jgi:hypothetical protein
MDTKEMEDLTRQCQQLGYHDCFKVHDRLSLKVN